MMLTYYVVAFLISLVLTGAYMLLWRKHYDVHITLVFALVPITNLAFLLQGAARSTEAALNAIRFSYIGGCFLQLMIVLTVFSLCRIRLSRWVRLLFYAVSTVVFLSALTIGQIPLFYQSAEVQEIDGRLVLVKEYGTMHVVFYVMVALYFVASIGVIVYSLVRKNQVSRKILMLLLLPELVCINCFFVGRRIFPEIELIPVGYIFAQVCYLCIVFRISLYNVVDTVAETVAGNGESCFITFDPRFNYLGSNDTAKEVLPELNNLTVDFGLERSKTLQQKILPWLEQYKAHPEDSEHNRYFENYGNRIYLFTVTSINSRRRLKGYGIVGVDDTLDRAHINLLTTFKETLEQQVREKTAHIVAMHDNLILSMATMVESRDNSTGGHIRRTSEGVRLLIDAVRETGAFDLSDEFCRNLIKAAPMHDLGKIAVDDAILRKPGRFEPEEFEVMKTHAAKGARIVHEILKDTDDDAFHILAENVAHYHHERWDGSGYPEGISGEAIPLEARIMAVADVYDALVSKRVYKEKMSFEKADAIILGGMGSQFDPALEPVYRAARPRLEAYYAALESPDEAGVLLLRI